MSAKLSAKFTKSAVKMPVLRNSMPGEPFDICRSEAACWLCSQPDIMQYVFDKAKDNGLIEYDGVAGSWQGIDYRKPTHRKPATENEDWLQATGLPRQF